MSLILLNHLLIQRHFEVIITKFDNFQLYYNSWL